MSLWNIIKSKFIKTNLNISNKEQNFTNKYSDIEESDRSSIATEYTINLGARSEVIEEQNPQYASISTSEDESVCPMCKQFEGKYFLLNDVPKLPLCPSCGCALEYFFTKDDIPDNLEFAESKNFILPSDYVDIFYKTQQKMYSDISINTKISACDRTLKYLNEFMAPYISAGFSAPEELACRDLLPELCIQTGKWKKAENTIKKCIEAKAYYPADGLEVLNDFTEYKEIAMDTLKIIEETPGVLQRNIYKLLPVQGKKREMLKHFLKKSDLIKKEKIGNTNALFLNNSNHTN